MTTNRETAPRARDSVDDRLARLLDTPLTRVVPHLAPEMLHQLIQYRGLDACGEVLASATPAQLTSLLDLDLWQHARPGGDEQFDVDRFGEWLEVLVDTGESVAARTVAALETSLVVEGLSRYVRVLDPGIFEPTAQTDDESIDRHDAMREGDRHAPGRDPPRPGYRTSCGLGPLSHRRDSTRVPVPGGHAAGRGAGRAAGRSPSGVSAARERRGEPSA